MFCILSDSDLRSFPIYLSVKSIVAKDLNIGWSGVPTSAGVSYFVCRSICANIFRRQCPLRKGTEVDARKSCPEMSFRVFETNLLEGHMSSTEMFFSLDQAFPDNHV